MKKKIRGVQHPPRKVPSALGVDHAECANRFCGLLSFVLWCVTLNLAVGAAPRPSETETRFVREVLPMLQTRCVVCHGKDNNDIRGGLDLRLRETMMLGGDSGQSAIDSDFPDQSPILLSVLREDDQWSAMPPKENDRLSESEIQSLRKWVHDGAIWPSEKRITEILDQSVWPQSTNSVEQTVATSPALDAAWQNRGYEAADLWAYRPLLEVEPPKPAEHPIDAFLDARLEAEGVTASPRAEINSLIRRATIDLIGLLPMVEDGREFRSDPSDSTWERFIDRQLSDPGYGEQMARYWLDVVRYADTAGFSNDFDQPHAWRYRDYVVRSFNDDKAYDRFVREQIDGDELPDATDETVIATGF